jgi:acetoin utilization deacetylase AcuC-like enzyme
MKELAYFYPQGHEAHYENGHPERPGRVEAIRKALQDEGLWDPYPKLDPINIPEEVLVNVHAPAYLAYLKQASQQEQHLDADTYTTQASWELAKKAAGGACAVAAAVWKGKARHGLALTRPPGHHATHNQGMGFCLLNNIALAAEYLIGKQGVQNLAIVDLDVHHGNGTQDIFYLREDVLFISLHQWPLYPGTGRIEEQGEGIGAGTTVNIPLPPTTGDQGYLAAMDEVVIPLLESYSPQMVLVSIGFDTHWRDPLANQLLSALAYAEMVSSLTQFSHASCEGRIALFLEGGYDLEAGAACLTGCVSGLLNREWNDPIGPSPQPEKNAWSGVLQKVRSTWGL